MGEYWVVVGDSFSDQRHSGYAEHGVRAWPQLLVERLGVEVRCYASSGDGYAHRRRETFPEQALRARDDRSFSHGEVVRVIVFGGVNDYSTGAPLDEVRAAARTTAETLVAAFPNARVDGYMNWYPHELDDAARACIDAIRAGLAEGGVELHEESMWIIERPAGVAGEAGAADAAGAVGAGMTEGAAREEPVEGAYLPDNLHPNQRGQALMADFFAAS